MIQLCISSTARASCKKGIEYLCLKFSFEKFSTQPLLDSASLNSADAPDLNFWFSFQHYTFDPTEQPSSFPVT